MKYPNIANALFLPLFSVFCATTLAQDETEWACTELKVLNDGHTVNYTCSATSSLSSAIALTSRSLGKRSSNSSSSNDPVDGSLDLNACVAATAGYSKAGGGLLMFKTDGCFANSCHNCYFVASNAQDNNMRAGPFGSKNSSLVCDECDSGEGLKMTKGSKDGRLAVEQFLQFSGDGLSCKDAGAKKKKIRRGADVPDWISMPPGVAPSNHQAASHDDHGHPSKHRRADDPPKSTAETCETRKNTPWRWLQENLTAAQCHDIQLLELDDADKAAQKKAMHKMQTVCPWSGTGDPAKARNITTILDLNDCLRNNKGTLEPGLNGGFADSCNSCKLSIGDDVGADGVKNVILLCECYALPRLLQNPRVYLNGLDTVQIVAGTLMCQDKMGVAHVDLLGQ
ncbi:hypothetical protein F4810DRAFT_689972 [Camillea tinctor]|nr:hypothetical protein F4810DRAFT_689972 [Camillea tinctor]